jgi:hypothetical protein
MAKKSKYQIAAEEINELPGFDQGIELGEGDEIIIKGIQEANEYINNDDELSEETRAVIEEVMNVEKPKKPAARKPVNKKVEPEPEEEEADEPDGVNLMEDIEGAETLKDLKDLAEENPDIFSDLNLKKFKDVEKLREAMSLAATVEPEEEEVEEEEVEEKSVAKKTVKKETKPATEKSPRGSKGTATKERVAYITPFIEKGKYNKAQLIEMLEKKFPDATKTGLITLLTDCKNPKYNRFDRLVVQDANGLYKFGK